MEGINEFYAWEKASQDTIDFKKIYVDVAGDLIAGLLLSQIIYWHIPDKHGKRRLRVFKRGEYWLAKNRSDWWEEVRITPKQYDRAIKLLKDKRIVVTKLFKFNGNPTTHIHLNEEVFLNLLKSHSDGLLPKGEKPIYPKVNNDIDQRVISLTEITAESTNIEYKTYNGYNSGELVTVCFLNKFNSKHKELINEIIAYFYSCYNEIFSAEHPKYRVEQMTTVYERLEELIADLDLIDPSDWEQLIDKYFNTTFINCDYKLSHFATYGIVENRFYEVLY